MTTIREAGESDLEQAADLVRRLDPAAIVSAASLRRRLPNAFVVEADGEVQGWAVAASGWIFVGVLPERRRRGVGGALLGRRVERQRGERVVAFALDGDGSRFLEHHDFVRSATLRLAVLDLSSAVLPELPEPHLPVVPLRNVRDRPEQLYELYMDTLRGLPNAEPFLEQSLEEWRVDVLGHPQLDDEITSTAGSASSRARSCTSTPACRSYSTVTVFARLRGWSTFRPRSRAIR